MRTRSQSLAEKRKNQDALLGVKESDEQADEIIPTTFKRRKTKKTLITEGLEELDTVEESDTVEKRLAGYRRTSTPAIRYRIQRAVSQRLYLLAVSSTTAEPTYREYTVFGQTGNIYTVIISHLLSCTCPDHAKGHLCKHIIFVLHRVLKVDRDSPLLFQKALLTTELKEIFEKADAQRNGSFAGSGVLAEQKVREAYRTATGDPNAIGSDATEPAPMVVTATTVQQKPITADDECPICCEAMEDGKGAANNIIFCSTSCGNSIHAACFQKWQRVKVLTGEPVTCPLCRVEWKTATNDGTEQTAAVYTTTGFLNLAAHSTNRINNAAYHRTPYYSYSGYYYNYSRRRRRRRDYY